MSDSTVVPLRQPDTIEDPLTAILRSGARRLLAQAIEAEAEAFLAEMKGARLPDGRERVVRHGHAPERLLQTGIGPAAVRRAKLRDRGAGGGDERIRFTSAILPRWARRTRSLDALLPILYLRGVSMGDLQEALGALLGKDAPNLSPSVVARLRGEWEADHARWQRRDLSARRYVYVWATASTLQAGWSRKPSACLVLIGATPREEGAARLPGRPAGELAELRDCWWTYKAPRLAVAPDWPPATARSAFWKALVAAPLDPGTSGAGCTRLERAELSCPAPASPTAKRDLCARSGRRRTARTARRRSPHSPRSTGPNTARRSRAWSRTARRCWPSTTSRPSTGTTCAPPTRSRACSPPSGTAPSGPRARCRRTPPG
jgi:hypothetical protein